MFDRTSVSEGSLRIVHILRSPVGGLFRHVLDLADAQIAQGHRVGLIADSSTGGRHAYGVLAALAPRLELGITQMPMRREPSSLDLATIVRVSRTLNRLRPDVVHGHGAKGALYARLSWVKGAAGRRPARVYTPHGGSLHYDAASLRGAAVLGMERLLVRRTDLILFESSYAADRFSTTIGVPSCLVRIVHNGLRTGEFKAVPPTPDAADFLFIGELRFLKGVDVLLEALAQVAGIVGRCPTAILVGAGADRERFEALANSLGIAGSVSFRDPMNARDAFAMGRTLIVPSRAESLPYIVLEAAAARIPMIATRVGGIPEIMGGADEHLVPPGDVASLAAAMAAQLTLPRERQHAAALALSRFVETRFAVGHMADAIVSGYRDAMAIAHGPQGRTPPRVSTSRPRYGL